MDAEELATANAALRECEWFNELVREGTLTEKQVRLG